MGDHTGRLQKFMDNVLALTRFPFDLQPLHYTTNAVKEYLLSFNRTEIIHGMQRHIRRTFTVQDIEALRNDARTEWFGILMGANAQVAESVFKLFQQMKASKATNNFTGIVLGLLVLCCTDPGAKELRMAGRHLMVPARQEGPLALYMAHLCFFRLGREEAASFLYKLAGRSKCVYAIVGLPRKVRCLSRFPLGYEKYFIRLQPGFD